ncbi:MMPL family transporter [Rubrobacter taiwanensis]|jgi:RND superfamily putative drug exporter|uniref:MMPL family transporter n=1 Tax=Rubrobacter taiwanensis TaxID=185139 RepID=A0A4R1BI37_9ACTN|nr:MMPL family transporter [Rubrobacter taiwanensis]TCJ16808.1 MMPL family transporter [Rubrobacter taiwanensis]
MRNLFYRLGSFDYRHRRLVIAVWACALVVAAFFAPQLSGQLRGGGFEGADSEAERVQEMMVEEFGISPAALTVVFTSDELPATSEEFQREEDRILEALREMPEVRSVTTYRDTQDPNFISEDGRKSYAVVGFRVSLDETQGLVDRVREKVGAGELETYVTGPPAVYLDIEEATNEDIRQAEKYAAPFALLILLIAFGSVVAAGVPIMMGLVSVATTLAILYFVSGVYDMSIFVLTIATMLGLALGIDYALFFVSRFREELEIHPVSEAVPRSVATAGRAIFFSGLTVLIGLSGLLFFPFMFIRSIGVGGVFVVFVAVSAALTLLPAALGVMGDRVNRLSVMRQRTGGGPFWRRSARLVMRRPVVIILTVVAVLLALLWPVTHMRIGVPEASVLPAEYESRIGDDILKEDFNYPALNPMQILVNTSGDPLSAENLRHLRTLTDEIATTPGVGEVESVYTVGEEAARAYAERVGEARARAGAAAAERVDDLTRQQLAQLGTVPPGAEERVRAEVELRVQRELEAELPDLPEGVSAEGEISPEGVANFLRSPEARQSEELQAALDSLVAGDLTLVRAVQEENPYTEEARAIVERVRAIEPPEGMSILVGGLSAGQKDFISELYGMAPYAVAFVLGVTYAVLAVTFRSFFLPIKAVIVNMLSLTASFGAMVWVFQDGHLSGLLDFTPLGFVDATVPILMFCTVFGVSMDYEVFLLSRIREAYEYGESNTESVAKGLSATAGIITSAAAIIVVVTGAFAFTGIILTKAVGLGLAVAVFVDATIIRVLLVPATMRILGDWNWWPGGRKGVFLGGRRRP